MNNHYHRDRGEHHEAVDSLFNLFTMANHDLNLVENRLQKEFQQTYPLNVNPYTLFFSHLVCSVYLFMFMCMFMQANPMELVSRIKKIQDELVFLKQECGHLLAAKQVFLLIVDLRLFVCCVMWVI